LDWGQQEFGIAAALSGDQAMQAAYLSGRLLSTFGKQAGGVPPDATKKRIAHSANGSSSVLAVQYGMGAQSLAMRLRSRYRRS
jgi:hypothetical protein